MNKNEPFSAAELAPFANAADILKKAALGFDDLSKLFSVIRQTRLEIGDVTVTIGKDLKLTVANGGLTVDADAGTITLNNPLQFDEGVCVYPFLMQEKKAKKKLNIKAKPFYDKNRW